MFKTNLVIIEKIRKLIRQNFLPENRVQTISEILAVIVWMVSTLMFYFLMQDIFPNQEFWKGGNLVAIVASFFIVDGMLFSFIFRNIFELSTRIENRDIDSVIVMPVGFKSYMSFRKIQFSSLIQIPVSLILTFVFIPFSPINLAIWFFSLILGFFIAYHIWYLLSLISFWLKIGETSTFIFEELSLISMFPALPFIVSRLFIFFFPFLTIAGFSAKGLLEGEWLKIIIIQLSTLLILVILTKITQALGLKKYRS